MRQERHIEGTDLHCHILPGIDDGAPDLEAAEALLLTQKEQGIRQILFTPHFYANQMELDSFLRRRYKSAVQIAGFCASHEIAGALGAEVRMESELLELELKPLALADTPYLLLEWPFVGYPLWGKEVVRRVFDAGLRPVFAHIERYDYFWEEPENLRGYIAEGVLCQMNASTVLRQSTRKQALQLIREGYVHVLASDAHSMKHRPPQLGEAFQVIRDKLGAAVEQRLRENADLVFRGADLCVPVPQNKRSFWPHL